MTGLAGLAAAKQKELPDMQNSAALSAEIRDHAAVIRAVAQDEALLSALDRACEICVGALGSGRKLLFCGNGGSAADCQHLATELTVRFTRDRRALAAIALTTDTSALTAIGNDFGFDHLFSRQVEALCQPGDVLLCFSTSGHSRNVILAVEAARARGAEVIFFGGKDGGALRGMASVPLVVPSDVTARIQEVHILFGHILCAQIEQRMGLV
ncbi:MAG: D-sedoheptulose 7-phosphate isomerase [Paracoccaceae bacterium]